MRNLLARTPRDLLRRNFHPLLAAAKIPKNGFRGFRRYRNTYLRNETECPDGLLKFWLGPRQAGICPTGTIWCGMTQTFDGPRPKPWEWVSNSRRS
jgi:hypothetical protein